MMYEEDVYAGARAASPPVPQVQPGQDVVGEVLERGMQEVWGQVGALLAQGTELEEAQHEFEAEAELLSVEADTRAEVERRLRLPDGDDGAFWDARGRFREVEVRNLYDRVGKRMRGVGGLLLDPERRGRVQGRAMLAEERMLKDMGEAWQKAQWERSAKAWKAAFDLAVDKDDRKGVLELLDKGVAAGLLLRDEAELKRRRLLGDWAVQASVQRRMPQLNMKRGGGRGKRRFSGVKFN